MSRRRIICEGPDDRSALRELLVRHFGLQVKRGTAPALEKVETLVPRGQAGPAVEIVIAGSKEKVRAQAIASEQYSSASDPIETLGLCFDPNGQSEAQWRSWLAAGLAPLTPQTAGDGWTVATVAGRARLLPLPWFSPAPVRYALPDHHNLERVAIHALAEAYPSLAPAIARWVDELPGLGGTPSWKTALRLWNAVVHPDAAGASFLDKVCGQDHQTGLRVRALLDGTLLWRGLADIAAPPPAPPPVPAA